MEKDLRRSSLNEMGEMFIFPLWLIELLRSTATKDKILSGETPGDDTRRDPRVFHLGELKTSLGEVEENVKWITNVYCFQRAFILLDSSSSRSKEKNNLMHQVAHCSV